MKILEVSGQYACFTRPELSVERYSYDIITPSAARNIFQSIFWKPVIDWKIKKIEILNPIKKLYLKRNEIGTIKKTPVFIEHHRTQKGSVILKDVSYRIHANLIYKGETTKEENHLKYSAMYDKRLSKGACFKQPYLGCREFSCLFSGKTNKQPIKESIDFGIMLYDINYKDDSRIFYHAIMNDGVIDVNSSEKYFKKG